MKIKVEHLDIFDLITKLIAIFIILLIIVTAIMVSVEATIGLYQGHPNIAIQDGLFVMLLLEMYYVIKSFIKYGRINISLVVNVGIIAVIKELVFHLESITLQTSLAFATISISLGILYLIEMYHFKKSK